MERSEEEGNTEVYIRFSGLLLHSRCPEDLKTRFLTRQRVVLKILAMSKKQSRTGDVIDISRSQINRIINIDDEYLIKTFISQYPNPSASNYVICLPRGHAHQKILVVFS